MDRPSDLQPARAELTRFTYQDYLGFPDDGQRHELIDGEHRVTPAPTRRHQEILVELVTALRYYLRAHRLGKIYAAPLDVILSDRDVVQPDILFVSEERREVLGKWVHGAPDLTIEITSPSSRRQDEIDKRHLYDRFGVREYWVIDPEIEVVKIWRRREDGTFPRAAELTLEAGDVLESPLLPDFALALSDLFG